MKYPITTGIVLFLVSVFIPWPILFVTVYALGILLIIYGIVKKFW